MVRWFTVVIFVLVASCQKVGSEPAATQVTAPEGLSSQVLGEDRKNGGFVENLRNLFLARIQRGAFGPRLMKTKGGWVAVWATDEGEDSAWVSVFISAARKASPVLRLADASERIRQIEVGELQGGGVGVLYIHRAESGEALSLLRLSGEGALQARPQVIVQSPSDILWAQVVRTGTGELVIWAERDQEVAQIYTSEVREGVARTSSRIARGVRSWQLKSHEGSVALVTLEGEAERVMTLRLLGGEGQLIGAPVSLARQVDGGLDVDLAMTDRRIAVVWSERRGLSTNLRRAILDASGNLLTPASDLTEPRGGQSLYRLLSDPKRDKIVALWEEPLLGKEGARRFQFASVAGSKLAHPEGGFFDQGQGGLFPISALSGSGFSAVIQSCESGVESCESPLLKLIFEGEGKTLETRVTSGGTKKGGSRSDMVWDLMCEEQKCVALSAKGSEPTDLSLSFMQAEKEISPQEESDVMTVESYEPLFSVPELSAQSGAPGPGRGSSVLSWLSYFDPNHPYQTPAKPAPDGRRAPVRALLKTVLVAADASANPPRETVISYRARSLGGVSLLAPNPDGLVVWAAMDQNQPQLFATVIGPDGRKVRQKMLTRTKGEVTDVTAVRVPGGFLLAWVDGRDGRSEVWVQVIDESLLQKGPAQRVSTGANQPTGVTALLARSSESVRLVWSDARSTDGTRGALYATEVNATSGQARGREFRLGEGKVHRHTPRLARGPDGSEILAWLESNSRSTRADGLDGGLHFAQLEGNRFASDPVQATGLTNVLEFDLQCNVQACRAAAVVQREGKSSLLGLRFQSLVRPPEAKHLFPLRARSASGVTPLLVGTEIFFADRIPQRIDDGGTEWVMIRSRIKW